MYACIPEIEHGFFEGVCPSSNATAHSCDPPHPATQENRSSAKVLRLEVDCAPRYRGRRFSLG
jgi:hypothetical protein